MQDTLSDMLVRIKNAQSAKKQEVIVISSKLNKYVCELLIEEGFIDAYAIEHIENKPYLKLKLKYYAGSPVIQHVKRVSKPSLRVYAKCRDIPRNVDGFGVLVISTPKGIMTHINAKRKNLGGEPLFLIN